MEDVRHEETLDMKNRWEFLQQEVNQWPVTRAGGNEVVDAMDLLDRKRRQVREELEACFERIFRVLEGKKKQVEEEVDRICEERRSGMLDLMEMKQMMHEFAALVPRMDQMDTLELFQMKIDKYLVMERRFVDLKQGFKFEKLQDVHNVFLLSMEPQMDVVNETISGLGQFCAPYTWTEHTAAFSPPKLPSELFEYSYCKKDITMQMENDGISFKKKESNGYHSAVFQHRTMQTGIHRWKIELKHAAWVGLGVVKKDRVDEGKFDDMTMIHRHGLWIASTNRFWWSPGKISSPSKFGFATGDTIECEMNCETRKLTISKGEKERFIISNIELPVCPVVVMLTGGDEVLFTL